MLSAEERQEIEREVGHYPRRRAGCIEALKVLQRHRGWVSDDAMQDVATLLDMSLDEVEGVATYYNLLFRRPVGRHVILLCDSVTCWMTGYDRLREHLAARLGIGLGETTADGRYTLLPVPCLGTCDRAPAMLIGEDLHQDLTPDTLDAILARYP